MKKAKKLIGASFLAVLILISGVNGVYAKNMKTSRISSCKSYGIFIPKISKLLKHKKSVSEEQVKNSIYALKEAEVKLYSNYDEILKNELKDEKEYRGSKKYEEVKLEVSSNYENALAAAKSISTDKEATKEQKLNAILNLIEAKIDLTVDYKDALKKEIAKEKEIRNKNEYKNAKLEVSSNYENALAAAKAILEDM